MMLGVPTVLAIIFFMTSGRNNYYCNLDEEDANAAYVVDAVAEADAVYAADPVAETVVEASWIPKDPPHAYRPPKPRCNDDWHDCTKCRGPYNTCCKDKNCMNGKKCKQG